MEALINKVVYKDQREGKYGMTYSYMITYTIDDVQKTGYYTSKSDSQKNFIEGQKADIIEEQRTSAKGKEYFTVKPFKPKNSSGYGKRLQVEQAKYSGFAMAYAKDLCVADKIRIDQLSEYTKKMFELMVELDKSIQQ